MPSIQQTRLAAALIGFCAGQPAFAEPDPSFGDLSLTRLEQRSAEIDSKLETLAHFSMRTGIGTVGFRSVPHTGSQNTEWVEIDLQGEFTVDQVVLVPVIWRDTKNGFRADGFPKAIKLIAGTDLDKSGKLIASYGSPNNLLPRIAPLVVPIQETKVSWLRLEATELSPRAWDGKFIFQLDEILIFSGQENVALNKPVSVSSNDELEGPSRRKENLVDGSMPYLMDAADGDQSIAFFSSGDLGERPTLLIDLGSVQPVNRIHLHTMELSDTIPQASPPGLGLPRRLVVEGAIQPDFSNPVFLTEYVNRSIYDGEPIIMRSFPETDCRYVRFIAIEPYIHTEKGQSESRIGFAEIEIFSKGNNVALGRPTTGNSKLTFPNRYYSALTDGHNLYGKILSIRDWMNELARRHELEKEKPLVSDELNRRYARQKVHLTWLAWLAGILAVGIIFTILLERIIRLRQVERIRERLAADLHDELGADLHTIGLLSDLAEAAKDNQEELSMLHQRIRRVTEETGLAVRHCSNMLQVNGSSTNIKADLHRTSRRIMAKLENDILIEGENHLNQLKPRTRFDLLLFYKECLINISRHSGATRFWTRLTADEKEIDLTVTDNGCGIVTNENREIPFSLKRRARLLGAKLAVYRPNSGGTCINLKLKTRSWKKSK